MNKREYKSVKGNTKKENTLIYCGCGCGNTFLKYGHNGWERKYLPGHNNRGKKFTNRVGRKHTKEENIEHGKKMRSWWMANKNSKKVQNRNKKIGENTSKKLNGYKRDKLFKEKISKNSSNLWKKKEYRERTLAAQRKGMQLKPNNPERAIINLIEKNNLSFEYVGDGKLWIDRFNPDFINQQKKKIIELFGNYWHNLQSYKIRDKKRFDVYKNNGYKTLVIWEREIKNPLQVLEKIKQFSEDY